MRRTRSPLALLLLPALVAVAPGAASARVGSGDPFLRRTPVVEAVEKVGPAVVNITTVRHRAGRPFRPFTGDPFFDRFFQDFFEPRRPQRTQSLGSGVVIDASRHVLTNEHVIARADAIRVTLGDGRELEATLVGADPNHDLAVLAIETDEEVPWVAPGTSADLMVGEPVIAIGNPFGLSHTVTTGVISAVNRSFRSDDRIFHGFLQTDASINPGNSGGPLLNAHGELVGINTAIYGGAQGIGFAIPIDAARRVVRELLTHGEVAPVWLGLDVQDLDPRLAELMRLPERLSGAVVSRVREDGPGAGAGVRRGDVVTGVDGAPVRSAREYYDLLERSTAGQQLELELRREGDTFETSARAQRIPDVELDALAERLLGLRLEAREGPGVAVARVRAGSGAARVGLQPGDRVLAVNGRRVEDAGSLRRAALDLRGRDRCLVVVQRGRGRYHVTLPLL
ncbi:MAG: trypsin-like peptidase domain-containing protein, partial [Myxococcota bacterium]|nr:trypsin-like peptidase domain-containing protein [Myxococcota bacterium]